MVAPQGDDARWHGRRPRRPTPARGRLRCCRPPRPPLRRVAGAAGTAAAASEAPPLPAPTLEDAAQLTPASDFTRFVAPGVDANVRNAALKHLFSDPHFNVMDGLDTYIDDYGKPDPLSPGMLRKMAQAEFLNLFADEKKASPETPAAAPARPEETVPDEDPALRLQPHDAAGPAGADPGPGTDPGRQH